MAQLKILTFPNPILAEKAKPVERVEKSLYTFADDMLQTMYSAPGVGLAANQVGVLKKILVLDIDYRNTKESKEFFQDQKEAEELSLIENRHPMILINPQIIYREGLQTYEEGCLSVPEFHYDVIRSKKIKVKYQNIDGLSKILSAEDFLAVVIQHEMDHLEGKLFIDRISLKDSVMIKRILKKKASHFKGELKRENNKKS